MKWKVFATLTLIIMSMISGLMIYATQPFEVRKLMLYALKWGVKPNEFIDIHGNPFEKQISSFVETSSIVGALEIPENSVIKTWAEGILGNSTWERINIKINEDYYSITIEYLFFSYSNSYYIALVSVILTVITWLVFISLLRKKSE